jgi:hypothetical protein
VTLSTARLPPLRARKPDRHVQQALQRMGRDLRRRRHRRSDNRPAHPPRRDPLPQGRQLPPQEPQPRRPTSRPARRLTPPDVVPATTRSASPTARLHEQPPQGCNSQPALRGQFSVGLDRAYRGDRFKLALLSRFRHFCGHFAVIQNIPIPSAGLRARAGDPGAVRNDGDRVRSGAQARGA